MVLTRSKKTAQESSDEARGTRGGGEDVVDPDIGHGNVEQQEDSTEDDNDYYTVGTAASLTMERLLARLCHRRRL